MTDEAFSFFLMMEKVIRRYLRVDRAKEISSGLRKEVKKKIIEDLDVIEKWNVVSEDMEDGIQTMLVEKVVDLLITIRGFSFAGSYMELYKQKEKTNLQKTKGLRKKVQST